MDLDFLQDNSKLVFKSDLHSLNSLQMFHKDISGYTVMGHLYQISWSLMYTNLVVWLAESHNQNLETWRSQFTSALRYGLFQCKCCKWHSRVQTIPKGINDFISWISTIKEKKKHRTANSNHKNVWKIVCDIWINTWQQEDQKDLPILLFVIYFLSYFSWKFKTFQNYSKTSISSPCLEPAGLNAHWEANGVPNYWTFKDQLQWKSSFWCL